MAFTLTDLLAPHYCCSCGELGAILCEYCKYDIVKDPFSICVQCRVPVLGDNHLCSSCSTPYTRAWCIGERDDALKKLIDSYKFERAQSAQRTLIELLDHSIPQLPENLLVVPIPTVTPHVRVRGYGHVELVASGFAKKRGLAYFPALKRRTMSVQRGANKAQRIAQAKAAYRADSVDGQVCLLIDDVYTTGATLEYASRELLAAGASEVWIAVLSRQPLEKNE
ncbi:MAG: phosphoribosyltransferase family protein [Micropruina sp.]